MQIHSFCSSSAREDIWLKIVLARFFNRVSFLRERPIMSQGSREATESAAGAALRMGACSTVTVFGVDFCGTSFYPYIKRR